MTEHTLGWGKLITSKCGDGIETWPAAEREAALAAIERGMQRLRPRYRSLHEISRETSRQGRDGLWQLLINVTIEAQK